MPWRDARSVPFTRLGVVSQVPSDGGVFAIMDGGDCLLVSESWNLKARLIDLINVLSGEENLTVTWETCSDQEREVRRWQLAGDLIQPREDGDFAARQLPGLQLRELLSRRTA